MWWRGERSRKRQRVGVSFGNVQGPGLPLFSAPSKISTVEGSAELRMSV